MPAGSVTTWLTPDLIAAVDALDLNNASLYPMGIQPVLGNNNEVEEDDLGAYVQGDFKFELGAHTLRGNVGVRYVQDGHDFDRATCSSPVSRPSQVATHDYDDTLPSLNLVYDISESLLLRFGAVESHDSPEPGPAHAGSRGQRFGQQPHRDGGQPDSRSVPRQVL